MQFVTGGTFNGKSGWVKAYNGISEENSLWFSAYHDDVLPESLNPLYDEIIVLEGIEQWVKKLLAGLTLEKLDKSGSCYWKNG